MPRVVLRFKVKHLLVVVLLLAISSLGVAHVSHSLLLNEARQADESGDRERALVLYDRFLARCLDCPQRPEALYRSAKTMPLRIPAPIMITSGDLRGWVRDTPDTAPVMSIEERLREIIEKHPDTPWAINALGVLGPTLIKERRWEEAEELILWGLGQPSDRIASMQVDLLKGRIDVAIGLRDFERAVVLAREYAKEFPEIALSYVYLKIGDSYLESGEITKAEVMYDRARQTRLEELQGQGLQSTTSPIDPWIVTDDDFTQRQEWLANARRLYREHGGSVIGRIEGADEESRRCRGHDWPVGQFWHSPVSANGNLPVDTHRFRWPLRVPRLASRRVHACASC